jgi:transcriptional regulator with XRE-family HTH domain
MPTAGAPARPELLPFGRRLRRLRMGRNLSQRWLAKEAGCSGAMLCWLEQGKASPGADILGRLADVLGVSMDGLWRGTGRCEGPASRERTLDEDQYRDGEEAAGAGRQTRPHTAAATVPGLPGPGAPGPAGGARRLLRDIVVAGQGRAS